MAKFSSSSSFLWQALLLPSKNPKLFSKIFFIYIISHGLLAIGFERSIEPILSKLNEVEKLLPTDDSSTPESTELLNTFKAGTKKFHIFYIVFSIFTSVTSSLLSIFTYYANSKTYLGEILTLKELFFGVKGIIKGPLITQLFVELFSFVYLDSLTRFVFKISWHVSSNYKISLWLVLTPLALLATLLFVYLVIIWSMGVAVSVIEPNLYGISAISHVTRLLKGKKMQLFLLSFSLTLAHGIVNVCNPIIMKFACGSKADSSLVRGFMAELLPQLVTLYTRMAITVLCFECNQSNADVGNKVESAKLPLLV